jgi:NAD(P)-dependent dehydrogenase (short-subunit alcohol dehydrogenase family)
MAFIELVRILTKKKMINDGGSVIAISSISSQMGLKSKLAYATSKAALNSAVLNLASELSNKKIRVNGILKGALTTDVQLNHVKDMFTLGSDKSGNSDLGLTTPQELGNLIAFLLSDKVKSMTGALVKLDGGYSL